MASSEAKAARPEAPDIAAQLDELRAEVERLAREHVAPAVAEATDAAEAQAEKLAAQVRAHPLAAVLVAAGVGYLLGRLTR